MDCKVVLLMAYIQQDSTILRLRLFLMLSNMYIGSASDALMHKKRSSKNAQHICISLLAAYVHYVTWFYEKFHN